MKRSIVLADQASAFPLSPQAQRLQLQYCLVFFAALLGVGTLLAYFLWNGYRQASMEAEVTARNTAAILDTRLDATLRRIEANLEQIAEQIPDEALLRKNVTTYQERLRHDLSLRIDHFAELNSFRVYDANGDDLYNTGPIVAHHNVADRSYFQCAQARPDTPLCFSEAIFGKISKKPVIGIAKALLGKNGDFQGVVMAAVELKYMSQLFSTLNLGPAGAVALRAIPDGALLARWPEVPRALNMPLNEDNPLRMALASGAKQGVLRFIAQTDGVERFYAFRCLEHYPFLLTVGQAVGDYLAAWRQTMAISLGFSAAVLLAWGLALQRLWRSALREWEAGRLLNETQFALDQTGVGVHWVDADSGRFLYVNAQACRMLGYSEAEMLALSVSDINPEFPPERFKKEAARLREQGYGRFETVHRCRDGRVFPVELVLYFQPARKNRNSHHIAFATDISQRKAAEQALLQAKNAAEAANRAKSVFLANMSHELRTPLNAILGFAQLMERDPSLAGSHHRELETINRAGHHLLSLINDVLEISRIEAGRTRVQNEAFDFDDMLRSVEEMIRVRAEQKGLAFSVQPQGSLPRYVYGDAHHLRQVLVNLLGNAVKYTDSGQVSLRLAPSAERMRFEVADTGSGIAPEEQQRIFQAFYQTAAGAAKGEGTGLGLAISREFVRLMGGELTVSSEPGRGSVFAFALALPEVEAPAVAAKPGRVLGLAPEQSAVRVLVAEDHADNRELITRMLTTVGFDVRAVENGEQAIASFLAWQPHFIWMDMRMPLMDGYQATQQIRALPGGDLVKIVALTASAFHEDRREILAAGCDDMLAKPVEEERLFQLMGDLLRLQYRYAEAEPGVAARNLPLDLTGLDADTRAAIRLAAEILDIDACAQLAERLRPQYPDTAAALEALLREFKFEEIQQAAAVDARREPG